jgi:hypothetical protein
VIEQRSCAILIEIDIRLQFEQRSCGIFLQSRKDGIIVENKIFFEYLA